MNTYELTYELINSQIDIGILVYLGILVYYDIVYLN